MAYVFPHIIDSGIVLSPITHYISYQVTACYRNVELKFMVQDMREEVELKLNAALKDPTPKIHPYPNPE